MRGLAMIGIQFTSANKQVIDEMVNTGDIAGAQARLLKYLEQNTNDVAKIMAGGLAESFEIAKNRAVDLLEKIGEGGLTTALKDVAHSLTAMAENRDAGNFFEGLGLASRLIVDSIYNIANGMTVLPNVSKLALGLMMEQFGRFVGVLGTVVPGLSNISEAIDKVGRQFADEARASLAGTAVSVINHSFDMARAVENFGKEADKSAELYKKAVATIASIRA